MDEKQFEILLGKLNNITKLLALNAVTGKELKEQVSLLSASGFQPKDIADILGKTPNHIRVILHGLRKKRSELPAEAISVEEQKEQAGDERSAGGK